MKNHHKHLFQSHIFYRDLHTKYPIIIRGEGVYIYDRDGHKIIDGASGAGVVCLGHGNERVIKALVDQAKKIAFTHLSTFSNVPIIELSNELCKMTHPKLNKVYFTSGGSEAVEAAIKLARQYHVERGNIEKFKIISRTISYHGATIGALSMTGQMYRRAKFVPMLSSFPRISPPYCYRCPFHTHSKKDCDLECAWDLERAILSEGAETVSAFIMEPIIGASAPAVAPPVGYIRIVKNICRKYDVLLIADEVMTGYGRTGKFLAIEHYEAVPHIIALSKAMSSGYTPLGAILVDDEVYNAIKHSKTGRFIHGHTFAGNPLSAAVGLEVLRIIKEENLVDRVRDMGEYLHKRLRELSHREIVGDVRCRGLLAGVEFVEKKRTKKPFPPEKKVNLLVGQRCLKNRLYVYPGGGSVGGTAGDHILIAPPYIITEEQIDEIVDIIDKSIRDVEKELLH